MPTPLIKAILFGPLLFLSFSSIKTQEQSSKTQPFTLTWVKGECRHCPFARQPIKDQIWSARRRAWGIGFLWNYHGQGAGDYVIVHTVDGGRTWKELSASRTHAVEPSFAFVNPKVGWFSYLNSSGEYVAQHTVDGGGARKAQDHYVQFVKFFNEREGYGYGSYKTERQCFFSHDRLASRSWTESWLPDIKFVDNAFFLNSQTGWIAGMNGEEAFILRTVDGGMHWDTAKVDAGPSVANIRDVFFLDDHRGWLISWAFNDDGTSLFKTQDGGKTWKADDDRSSFQGKRKWFISGSFCQQQGWILLSIQ